MATKLLSYAEAAARIEQYVAALRKNAVSEPIPMETVALAAASGRVLAEAIIADRDQPPFPRSTRDGFACRAAEANSHGFLRLSGAVRAGQAGSGPLGEGEAWEIMTGAPVPEGADAVFMVEYAECVGDSVRLLPPRLLAPGENIVPQGAEACGGDLLAGAGVRLSAAQIALGAQCGYPQLAVVRRPRVAILATGDELVPVASSPGPSQIRNSNSPMLAALVSAAGAEPVVTDAVADRAEALDAAIATALDGHLDLLLVSGGISAGRFDLVEDALLRAGGRFFFHGVAMQPGKPVGFGELPAAAGRPVPFFALPGNPISSAVTFRLFAAPVLAALSGDLAPDPRFALAKLAAGWRGKRGLTRFLPAWCDFGLAPEVRLIPWQGSGDLAAFARSNCFIVIPPEAEEVAAGTHVPILL